MSSSAHSKHSLIRTPRARRPITIATIVGGATLALILGGCGGSAASRSHSAGTPATAVASAPPTTSTAAAHASTGTGGQRPAPSGAKKARNLVTGSRSILQADVTKAGVVQHSKGPGDYEGNTPGPQGPNPCVFMSEAAAQSIIGEPIIGQTEAPLGPTCVFKLRGPLHTVTIAVESRVVMTEARYMRRRRDINLGGHAGYCGVLGRPMLDLSLGSGQMLNVTAPCTTAEQLALRALTAKALTHLVA